MASPPVADELLGILLEAGRITDEQYKAVSAEAASTGKPVDQILSAKRIVEDEFLTKAKGTMFGIPYVDLQGKDITSAILNLVPRSVAENMHAVSFDRDGEHVSIGLLDPRDVGAMQAVDFLFQDAGLHPKYFIISAASYAFVVKKYATIGKDVSSALEAAKEKYVSEKKAVAPEAGQKLEDVIKGAPVSRIISVVLRHAVEGGASDIHIEPFGDETRIRYRVDGVLRTTLTLPKYIHASLVARVKVLANMKLDETRIPQDGRITETVDGKLIDFRVSTMPLSDSETVVMRILDTTRGVPTLEQLGFRKEFVEIIAKEARKPHGIFLITGPTGSGKSTTLLTVLTMRNEEGVNIATLEDPVEYYIKGVNQSNIRDEVGYTFAAGLRAILRQDPNIIMVGEIRDGETAELAIHAALTGHLIFSTLHTNDALGVVSRLADMHVEPFLLSATLNVAIAQRLARKICDRCKAPTQIPPEVEAKVRKEIDEIPAGYKSQLDVSGPSLAFFKGRGCVRCNNSGYAGRVAAAEIIVYDQELRGLITKGFPPEEVKKILVRQGAITLRQDALLKALEGSTTIEEVMRITAE
jgi:type IV pilus assembly protein PilB